MREALMRHDRDWITAYQIENSNVSCWNGKSADAVIICVLTARLRLTEAFETFTQARENWSFGCGILDFFPEAVECGMLVRSGAA